LLLDVIDIEPDIDRTVLAEALRDIDFEEYLEFRSQA